MSRLFMMIAIATWTCGGVAMDAAAQKGVGDAEGVARTNPSSEVVLLEGVVKKVASGPCESTTGRSVLGTHVDIETANGDVLNIHLGPKADVAHVARRLVVGDKLTVAGFRTEKLPANAYIAKSLTVGDETLELRDASLRPVWAGRTAVRDDGDRAPNFADRGRGGGRGRGQGYGMGRGRGQGMGMGGGYGRARGYRAAACPERMRQVINLIEKSELNAEERAGLLQMGEEEKLAHDVYVTLKEKWPLRPLANIPRAERTHMEMVKTLLDRHGMDDPVDGMPTGKFATVEMQQLHDALVARGMESIEGAVEVGLRIEELDIRDLRELLEKTDDRDVRIVYQNLLKGSRNHLRAFGRQLERLELTYEPTYLEKAEFDRIVRSDHERGTMILDPDFAF